MVDSWIIHSRELSEISSFNFSMSSKLLCPFYSRRWSQRRWLHQWPPERGQRRPRRATVRRAPRLRLRGRRVVSRLPQLSQQQQHGLGAELRLPQRLGSTVQEACWYVRQLDIEEDGLCVCLRSAAFALVLDVLNSIRKNWFKCVINYSCHVICHVINPLAPSDYCPFLTWRLNWIFKKKNVMLPGRNFNYLNIFVALLPSKQ